LLAFAALDYHALIRHVTCKTLIFYGEKEAVKYPDLVRRCTLTAKDIPGARLIKVPKAGHAVDDANYIAAIRENIQPDTITP
jgi:pimeloyl-ACP methyl ester carboxylesterase